VPRAQLALGRLLRPLVARWLRLEVDGRDNVPEVGPVLLAATHRSHADSMAIGAALDRPVHFLGDVRLTRWPVVGRTLPSFGMVPIARGERDATTLRRVAELLTGTGACLVVYPEGTRSRDGRVHRLRGGLARIAAATASPVVPVAVIGTERAWPIGRPPRLRGARARVRFGPSLPAPAPHAADRRAFSERLQAELVALAGTTAAASLAPIRGRSEA
jgi:1-acyl-sn-glycerol-3-phosphate acyltransferase